MELVISAAEGRARKLKLNTSPVSLGRAPDNDLAYPDDPWLSRYHLRIEPVENTWVVTDCGSRNGTRVNGAALTSAYRLRRGDRVEAGKLTIDIEGFSSESQLVEFVADGPGESSESTVVTNLSRVLCSSEEISDQPETQLSSARAAQALLRAGQELAGHRPLPELFPLILDLALSAVQARRGVIMTLEPAGLMVRASRGQDFSISSSVRDRVLLRRESLMVEDALVDRHLRSQHSIVAEHVRSILAVPLQTGSQVIGLLYIDNESVLQPFGHDDLALLTVMANVAAIRIEHARLLEIEGQEKLIAFEIAQAHDIQRNLLPSEPPQFGSGELGGTNLPCRGVGGDYYDYFSYQDGRIAIVLGDVCGKGLPAALMMSSLQARVQMLGETQPLPDEAMGALNRSVCLRCPPGKFITLFYGLLDTRTGRLQFSSAGHTYPQLVHADGSVQSLQTSGMVLGLLPGSRYPVGEAQLKDGDVLAIYSDGVTEASNSSGEEFGEEGLIRFIQQHRNLTVEAMLKELRTTLHAWTDRQVFADDFTAVFVKWHGSGSGGTAE